MNWEAFGAIAEMIGGIAVLVTLVYLALQVRQNSVLLEQNTKIARQSILRSQTDRYIANCHFIAGDSGICGIYQRAMKDPSSVTREEWWRFGTYMYGMFKDYEEMFLLLRKTRRVHIDGLMPRGTLFSTSVLPEAGSGGSQMRKNCSL